MTNIDQMIAAAQLRHTTSAGAPADAPATNLRERIELLIGADVVAALEEFDISPDYGIGRFMYHGLDYSLELLPVGVVLTRHDPPMPEGMQRPRPYSAFSGYWQSGETPGHDWFLLTLGQLAEATRR